MPLKYIVGKFEYKIKKIILLSGLDGQDVKNY